MNILFLSDTGVSLQGGDVRNTALLFALAEANYQIDVIAPYLELPDHPRIRNLAPRKTPSVFTPLILRIKAFQAILSSSYDAVHACGRIAFFSSTLCRWKKIPMVYDAATCFSGRSSCSSSSRFRSFSRKKEKALLDSATRTLSSSERLAQKLQKISTNIESVQLKDIPLQPLLAHFGIKSTPNSRTGEGPVVFFSILSPPSMSLSKLFLATRKVLDALPNCTFFFYGTDDASTRKLLTHLDLQDACTLLPSNRIEDFLSALSQADATVFIPASSRNDLHPQIYTLLQTGIPLLAPDHPAYREVLDASVSISFLTEPDELSDTILSVLREPLFSHPIALKGQQRVTQHHTCSSFKHRIRMLYYDLFEEE